MALNLTKAQPALNLTKSLPNKTKYTVGLAWDQEGDLDTSAVLLKNGLRSDLVYYQNLTAKGIVHNGDALDGFADGDDETMDIDLSEVDADEVVVVITSYNSGSFGANSNPVARLYEKGSTKALVEADLASEAAFGTAVSLVRFFKEGDDWKFENISDTLGSSSNGLEDVINKYAA